MLPIVYRWDPPYAWVLRTLNNFTDKNGMGKKGYIVIKQEDEESSEYGILQAYHSSS